MMDCSAQMTTAAKMSASLAMLPSKRGLHANEPCRRRAQGEMVDMPPDPWSQLSGEERIPMTCAPDDKVADVVRAAGRPQARPRFQAPLGRLPRDPRVLGQGAKNEPRTMLTRIDDAPAAELQPNPLPSRRFAGTTAGKGARK